MNSFLIIFRDHGSESFLQITPKFRLKSFNRMKNFFSAVCILTITLGIARFGFTTMFPIMQSEAGLGTAERGWITSAHYLGYLIGVFIAFTLENTKKK